MFKNFIIALIVLLSTYSYVNGQTTLSAGDIAIIAMNTDGNYEFSFVLLTDITNGTEIKFSESGWLSAGGFRGGGSGSEGLITWTANTDLSCGTEVTITSTGTATSSGSTSVTGSWALSTSGDQILAYQGTSASPTFIYAINNNGAGVWQADATSTNNSALPTGLTNGTNAVAVNEADNVKYDCSTTTPPATILSEVSDNSNWLSDNATAYTLPINCGFTCVACVPDSEPTANSVTLNFSNINCNSLDLDWTTEGNGTNRIVVISTSAISGTPTDQTNYTANSVYASGNTIAAGEYVIYNGTGNSTTVTGLTVNTTYYFAIFEYNGTTSNCTENYFTTSVLTGNEITSTSTPSTNASAYTFSLIGCNGFTLDWTSPAANGGSMVVIKAGSDVTTDPTDGTTYTADNTFGNGSDIGTNEFVVYNGNGTSVNITGLSASTTYYVNVFEYNGSGSCIQFRVSDEVSSNETTTACTDCPYLTTMLVNSCDESPCTEGDNEMFFFNSMDYYLSTAAADVTVNYGSSSPATGTYADAFTSTTDYDALDSMNADAGCSNRFIDASTVSHIPAHSTFLMLNQSICADAFDWSSICSGTSGNIYVLFSDDGTWNGVGQFSNNPTGSRYFRTILGGCTVDYSYDNTLNNADGGYVTWSSSAGGAADYGTDGCSLPATILPIDLLSFKGKEISSGNLLEWTTKTEINNDYFTLERSKDAINFTEIGTIEGAGNSTHLINYNFTDQEPHNGINYYRLKQTDFNGSYTYSKLISLSNDKYGAKIFVTKNNLQIKLNGEIKTGNLKIIDTLGRVILEESISERNTINLESFVKGIYLIAVETPTNTFIKKVKF